MEDNSDIGRFGDVIKTSNSSFCTDHYENSDPDNCYGESDTDWSYSDVRKSGEFRHMKRECIEKGKHDGPAIVPQIEHCEETGMSFITV